MLPLLEGYSRVNDSTESVGFWTLPSLAISSVPDVSSLASAMKIGEPLYGCHPSPSFCKIRSLIPFLALPDVLFALATKILDVKPDKYSDTSFADRSELPEARSNKSSSGF